MKRLRLPCFCPILLTLCSTAPALAEDAVLQEVDAIRAPSDNFTFHIQLDGQSEATTIHHAFDVAVLESRKSLIVYKQPIDQRGRALLLIDHNMWIHIPGTSRAIRISPQQQLAGPVSYADVARVAFHLDYQVMQQQAMSAPHRRGLLLLKLKARNETANYRFVDLVVSEPEHAPQRADFYAASGKLLRSIEFGDYEFILGKLRPTVLTISDRLHEGEAMRLKYSEFHNRALPAEFFQPAYLLNIN